jgi:hypothetical protein
MDGINTASLAAISLAMFIQRAEADIDAFMGFDLNQGGGFEPHTVWLQSQFDQETRKLGAPNTIVPQRRILRYRIQVSNLTSGDGFFANIRKEDVALNVTDAYIEIIPLQSITYDLVPVLIDLGLHPPIVQTDTEVGFYITHWKEPLFPIGGNTYASTRAFWATSYTQSLATQPNTLPPIPAVLYVNGVIQDVSTYNLDPIEGQITLHQGLSGNPVIQCDYTSTIPDNVVSATISRTTYLLGQARLNQQGLSGIETVKTGDQMISRSKDSKGSTVEGAYGSLDQTSAGYLATYVPIAVA